MRYALAALLAVMFSCRLEPATYRGLPDGAACAFVDNSLHLQMCVAGSRQYTCVNGDYAGCQGARWECAPGGPPIGRRPVDE